MAKRLTIAVPEPLFLRLQKVKKNLNISAICQEALDMAISSQELHLATPTADQLIERLKIEKKAMLNQAKNEGFKLGVESSPSLSFQDFQNLEVRTRCAGAIAIHFDDESLEDLWQFLSKRNDPNHWNLNSPGLMQFLHTTPQAKGAFVQGWIEGVLSVWKDIKNQV
ncbi:MAG: hypothetical protein AB4041_09195 [Microcystaceae cyanobacterium]